MITHTHDTRGSPEAGRGEGGKKLAARKRTRECRSKKKRRGEGLKKIIPVKTNFPYIDYTNLLYYVVVELCVRTQKCFQMFSFFLSLFEKLCSGTEKWGLREYVVVLSACVIFMGRRNTYVQSFLFSLLGSSQKKIFCPLALRRSKLKFFLFWVVVAVEIVATFYFKEKKCTYRLHFN